MIHAANPAQDKVFFGSFSKKRTSFPPFPARFVPRRAAAWGWRLVKNSLTAPIFDRN
jgi:hypothetical protein